MEYSVYLKLKAGLEVYGDLDPDFFKLAESKLEKLLDPDDEVNVYAGPGTMVKAAAMAVHYCDLDPEDADFSAVAAPESGSCNLLWA